MPLRGRSGIGFALVVGLLVQFAACSPAVAESVKYCSDTADNVVVFVDKTTPYDELDKKDLVDGVSRLFETLKGGERFVIRTITDSFTTSSVLMDTCTPICANNGFFGDLFSDCTEGVVINDKKHLRDSVVRQLKGLLADFVELPHSEIIRTLSYSASAEFRPGRANRFYLFTDLIENSEYLPGKSFFSERNDVLLRRVKRDGLIPNLPGAVVRVFGVGRGGRPGDRHPLNQALLTKLLGFWQRYFKAAGATITIQQALGSVE